MSAKRSQPSKNTAASSKAAKVATPPARRRRASKRPRVLITGISGGMGRLLAKRLHRVAEVHGVDLRPFVGKPKDVVMHHVDLRKKRCEDLFRLNHYQAVFHLGILHDPRRSAEEHHSVNLTGTMKILEYCQRYGVNKVILLSSATIYGPRPTNPIFLTEDSPLLAGERFPQIRDQIELDMLAQSFFWKHHEIETVILRPVHVVGPNITNAMTTYLRLKRVPRLFGFDPLVQIIHEQDVIEALALSMRSGVRGIFNITGPTAVPISTLIETLGKSTIPVPHPFARFIADHLWRLKLSELPAPQIDYARFICTVDGSRAERILNFKSRYGIRQTLADLAES